MSNVGWSTLDVIPSVKNLRSELDRQTRADFTAAGRRGGQQFGDAAGREAGGRFKTKMSPILRDVFAPAAGVLAGAGLVRGFGSLIDSASDAQQSVGGVQAVFKDYADEVVKDSKRAEQGLGLSTTAYQELVTVTGALLKNKGLEDFADQAETLLGIGADLAAQFGGPTSQAVEALNAALRGESDPIERYAISLNESAVNAVLAANGQKNLTGAALEQAKTQARLALITKQSADAQGAFARESDTQAGAAARTSAQWANMRAELGEKLLPATQAFTTFLNHDALPALNGAGGAVGDLVGEVNDLPGPVKAAGAAWVAYRIAQASGVSTRIGGALSATGSALDSIRIRGMLAADMYRELRAGQLQIIQGSGKFTPAMGRMASALGAIEVGAIGAGRGIRRGLSGALGLVGGPWGAAFIAGTAIVAHFWQEHLKAKQRVEDFTATLDKQTGALTESSREFAAKTLLDAGALDAAKRLGVGLDLVTDAALGKDAAMASLRNQIGSRGQLDNQAAEDAITLKSAIDDQSGVVQSAISGQILFTAAMGKTDAATGKTTTATGKYRDTLDEARGSVRKLLDAENARRNKLLGRAQDELALADAIRAAQKEAKEGKKTLDENTEAGSANKHALFDLAAQWNDSATKVRNAKGAYHDMRQTFIDVAESMGAGHTQARNLADDLLSLPKHRAIDVTTPGMDAALDKVAELERLLRRTQRYSRILIQSQVTRNRDQFSDIRNAGGGLLRGPGTGTSDSIPLWGSDGEFMQRKRAVDYYGVDYMRRLNALQVPRLAGGGSIGAPQATSSSPLGHEIVGVLRLDGSVAYIEGVARQVSDSSDAARLRARRAGGIGGPPV